MIINNVQADGFRNLSGVDISLSEGLNVISGENAQGKTNLLECIWMMTGVRSFRGAKERELIGFDTGGFNCSLSFTDNERTQQIEMNISKTAKQIITLNSVPLERKSKLFGKLLAVVFTPEDLALASGEPQKRRLFADLSVSQIKASYASVLQRYNRILAQRNAYLKSLKTHVGTKTAFDTDIWDLQLAKAGSFITVYRNVYIKMLAKAAAIIHGELTNGREELVVSYRSSVIKDDIPETIENDLPEYYLSRMESRAAEDRKLGTTLVGVHRDDIYITVNGASVREYGSQGQQRSAALSLKLAQAKILSLETGEAPVVLLDDVLSELDSGRRRFILDNLSGFQTLITACENCTGDGKHFTVRKGKVS
jgi:DNA replication and repair protein RecF